MCNSFNIEMVKVLQRRHHALHQAFLDLWEINEVQAADPIFSGVQDELTSVSYALKSIKSIYRGTPDA